MQMNDHISRQAALDMVDHLTEIYVNNLPPMLNKADVDDNLRLLPSADVPHWIPCSERMPEKSDEVLTTYIVNGNTKKRYVETATWLVDNSDEGGCWTSAYDEYRILGTRIERIAWMPLPLPYKDGERNDRT